MSHNKINYLDILQEKGYRFTRQRQIVLDAVCQADGHATLAEIYYHSKKYDAGIHRSTVYRCLDLFASLGLAVIGQNIDGERTFELVKEKHHHHLICSRCGHHADIDNELVDDFYQLLKTEYAYYVDMDHLIIFGLCPACAG